MPICRAASHLHSTWSYDGQWELERLRHLFERLGYSALLMAEHDCGFDEAKWADYVDACEAASSPRCLVVPGMEYSDARNRVHVLAWATEIPFLGRSRATAAVVEEVTEHGGVAVLAHPDAEIVNRILGHELVGRFHGMEVWNSKSDGWQPRADMLRYAIESNIRPWSGMDFHVPKHFLPGSIRLPSVASVSREGIVGALLRGDYSCTAFGMRVERFEHPIVGGAARVCHRTRKTTMKLLRALSITR